MNSASTRWFVTHSDLLNVLQQTLAVAATSCCAAAALGQAAVMVFAIAAVGLPP